MINLLDPRDPNISNNIRYGLGFDDATACTCEWIILYGPIVNIADSTNLGLRKKQSAGRQHTYTPWKTSQTELVRGLRLGSVSIALSLNWNRNTEQALLVA